MTATNTAPASVTAIETIALAKLAPSKENVRRTNSQAGIEELSASIEAHGLLQNLTVRKGAKGKFEVVAGARRLGALRHLAGEGRIAKDFPVPCHVLTDANDTEISLAENMMRSSMLGSVSRLSCWIRTAVMVVGDIRGAYRGRHTDVRVKRSRSVARTTLEAAATPQAF